MGWYCARRGGEGLSAGVGSAAGCIPGVDRGAPIITSGTESETSTFVRGKFEICWFVVVFVFFMCGYWSVVPVGGVRFVVELVVK